MADTIDNMDEIMGIGPASSGNVERITVPTQDQVLKLLFNDTHDTAKECRQRIEKDVGDAVKVVMKGVQEIQSANMFFESEDEVEAVRALTRSTLNAATSAIDGLNDLQRAKTASTKLLSKTLPRMSDVGKVQELLSNLVGIIRNMPREMPPSGLVTSDPQPIDESLESRLRMWDFNLAAALHNGHGKLVEDMLKDALDADTHIVLNGTDGTIKPENVCMTEDMFRLAFPRAKSLSEPDFTVVYSDYAWTLDINHRIEVAFYLESDAIFLDTGRASRLSIRPGLADPGHHLRGNGYPAARRVDRGPIPKHGMPAKDRFLQVVKDSSTTRSSHVGVDMVRLVHGADEDKAHAALSEYHIYKVASQDVQDWWRCSIRKDRQLGYVLLEFLSAGASAHAQFCSDPKIGDLVTSAHGHRAQQDEDEERATNTPASA